MSNTKKIVGLIREIVKQEVQKEVRKILISEGAKAISNNVNDVPEVYQNLFLESLSLKK